MTSLLSLIGVLHANYWGARWLDEPLGRNIGGLEPLGPHEVGAYDDRPITSNFAKLHIKIAFQQIIILDVIIDM